MKERLENVALADSSEFINLYKDTFKKEEKSGT
jgi:hypothetical protein